MKIKLCKCGHIATSHNLSNYNKLGKYSHTVYNQCKLNSCDCKKYKFKEK